MARKQTFSDLPDDRLVAMLSGPDWAEGLATLWTRHMGLLWNTARNCCYSDEEAADAIGDAFTKLASLASQGRLQIRSSFRSLATTTVRNTAIERYRRTKRTTIAAEPIAEAATDGLDLPASRFVDSEDNAIIAAVFAGLPERERNVLWLTEVEGLPPREVAEVVGLSANYVSQIASRARRALRTGFVDRHLTLTVTDEVCAGVQRQFPGRLTEQLSSSASSGVESHLNDCARCQAVFKDLRDDTRALYSLMVLPLAGLLGTNTWLESAKAASAVPDMGSVSSRSSGGDATAGPGAEATLATAVKSTSLSWPVVSLVAAVVAVTSVAAVRLTGGSDPGSSTGDPTGSGANTQVVQAYIEDWDFSAGPDADPTLNLIPLDTSFSCDGDNCRLAIPGLLPDDLLVTRTQIEQGASFELKTSARATKWTECFVLPLIGSSVIQPWDGQDCQSYLDVPVPTGSIDTRRAWPYVYCRRPGDAMNVGDPSTAKSEEVVVLAAVQYGIGIGVLEDVFGQTPDPEPSVGDVRVNYECDEFLEMLDVFPSGGFIQYYLNITNGFVNAQLRAKPRS